jgi:hypothetical protein
VEQVTIELDPSLTKRGKPKKDPQKQKEQDKLPQVDSRREPKVTNIVLNLPAKLSNPTFITCGRFYLIPRQQAEASCFKKDKITATIPRPDTLLRDPLKTLYLL